jgi:hypothetical protein
VNQRLLTFVTATVLLYLSLNIWVLFIRWAVAACFPVGFCR